MIDDLATSATWVNAGRARTRGDRAGRLAPHARVVVSWPAPAAMCLAVSM